ncbi:nucleocapsid protein [avian paramyxovirus 7]|uniref:Nucleocapsid n=1 Tax=avian paramyxovirus 7 TaxID=2560317 RepID=C6FGY6_9MONO|nr:nucleocapsid protein [Avian metaavulavirus 7]ACN72640.1 nucleocapsid protein [Avian metaavulavirus 7]
MSSIFTDYTNLQEQLVRPVGRKVDNASSGLLKVEIPVCVLNSQDPVERHQFAVLCTRWISSSIATTPVKQGALLSLLSLHTENMRAHVLLAARSGDANITILEVDHVDVEKGELQFNARSGVSSDKADRLLAVAMNLIAGCQNNSPFVDPSIEGDEPTDMTEFLELAYGLAVQAWVAAIKSMTAPDTAAESEGRRLAKYQQQGRLTRRAALQATVRGELQRIIRGSLVVRHFLIGEIRRAGSMGEQTTAYYAMVGDVSQYIKNSGMTAFFLTLRFGVGTKYPPLAMAAFSGDLTKLQSLIRLYRNKGDIGPYMALLEDPDMGNFAPANYTLLYSYAMGIGSVLEASIGRYQYARTFLNESFFRLGASTAQQQQGALDEKLANEMGLSDQARAAVSRLVNEMDMDQQVAPTPVNPVFAGDQAAPQANPPAQPRQNDTPQQPAPLQQPIRIAMPQNYDDMPDLEM